MMKISCDAVTQAKFAVYIIKTKQKIMIKMLMFFLRRNISKSQKANYSYEMFGFSRCLLQSLAVSGSQNWSRWVTQP